MQKPWWIYIIGFAGRIFFFFFELFRYPRIFFNRRLFWRKYYKGGLFRRIKTYKLQNEERLTRHFLTTWYLKPNFDKLDDDIKAIIAVKEIRYNAIRFNKIEDRDYDTITASLKRGSKKTWEPFIEIIEEMTYYFPKIKDFVVRMTDDKSGHVRETALLILEEGNFSFNERKNIYQKLTGDKNKKVKERVLDMIYREGKKKQTEFKDILDDWLKKEEDYHIKQHIEGSLRRTNAA